MSLEGKPVTLAEANTFVKKVHRHHAPTTGHRFSLGVQQDGELVGVAICGRPVARALGQMEWLEVLRVATDGTPNACSYLYGAAARAGVAMGYKRYRIFTYTLESESGASLRAAGWVPDKTVRGREWDTPSRRRTIRTPVQTENKVRWLAASPPPVVAACERCQGTKVVLDLLGRTGPCLCVPRPEVGDTAWIIRGEGS